MDQLAKLKNLPESQQEAFKTGFTEGFMRSQAFTQRTQGTCPPAVPSVSPRGASTDPCVCSVSTDSLRRTRLILLVLLLLGIYGLSRTPFLSGKGSFSDAGLFQFPFSLPSSLHARRKHNTARVSPGRFSDVFCWIVCSQSTPVEFTCCFLLYCSNTHVIDACISCRSDDESDESLC